MPVPPPAAIAASTALLLDFDGTLRIQTGTLPQPGFSSVVLNGNSLVLSGTNGVAGQKFVLMSSTNVAAPANQWLPVLTKTFGPGGEFNVTNTINTSTSKEFFYLR